MLTRVALRYRALYLPVSRQDIDLHSAPPSPVLSFIIRLKENGFSVSEELLHALCMVSADELVLITKVIREVMGVELNWMPLVKGWDLPTGETGADHLITMVANLLGGAAGGIKGTTLPCGHFIPEGTFPLERYNGCPFCGKPFRTDLFIFQGQASKLKELRLFTEDDIKEVFRSLLSSPTPLDGTQKDSLEKLLSLYDLPQDVQITMKETAMLVVHSFVMQGKDDEAARLMATPTDVLRYLWYEKTGYVQIIEPRTLISHARKCYSHMFGPLDRSAQASVEMKKKLMLKYSRRDCRRVAAWLNGIPMTATQAAENMNPKRGMWVRMIRALRLGEYSRRKGYGHLARLLDVFYRQAYTTLQGTLEQARRANDAPAVFALLKSRPGLFARCLFATMLRFGGKETAAVFAEVAHKLPSRLLLSLCNAAELYFNPKEVRIARPLTGGSKRIPVNKLLKLYSEEELNAMVALVNGIYLQCMKNRFAAEETQSKTIFIDPMLFYIPVSVGDRSFTVQDSSCALLGMRFPVEGDAVRLFLQWGKGLPAQHLDMDLSCNIAFEDDRVEACAFYSLTATGAKHSGDIRCIPDRVGTAEYIELDLKVLTEQAARYVTFVCNAYSCGTLSPGLVVGWMDSAYPMQISESTGVAYDPSCVSHSVRIGESNLSKGLVFGILDVLSREIIWLEMPFTSQTINGFDLRSVQALLHRLASKLTVGELLRLKASAQHLTLTASPEGADECYTYEWALNAAAVSGVMGL